MARKTTLYRVHLAGSYLALLPDGSLLWTCRAKAVQLSRGEAEDLALRIEKQARDYYASRKQSPPFSLHAQIVPATGGMPITRRKRA